MNQQAVHPLYACGGVRIQIPSSWVRSIIIAKQELMFLHKMLRVFGSVNCLLNIDVLREMQPESINIVNVASNVMSLLWISPIVANVN